MGFCKFNEIAAGTSGRRPLQRFIVPVRRGRCPHIAPPDKCAFCGGTHGSRPTGYAGHAGWDGGDAVPYNGSPYPSAGGRCPHIAPPDKCAFCGGTHGSRPTGYAGHAGRDVEDAVPYNGSSHPSAGGDAHTSPRRQHKEAGASACLSVVSVVRLFTWRSWRPHDRRGRPSDSAP